jgi:hypothetical protein
MSGCPTDPDEPPAWLADWQRDGLAPEAALARFDEAAPVTPASILGLWRGSGLPTGHPLDGVLEALGWWGKRFTDPDRVDPLLFSRPGEQPLALEAALMPTRLALARPALARSRLVRGLFGHLLPLLRARGPGARLRMVPFRGRTSAAMIYRRQPITDHFRLLARDRLIGCMIDARIDRPFFFLLTRHPRACRGG